MPVPSRIDSSMVMMSARKSDFSPSPITQLPKIVPTPVCVIMPMMVPTMAQAAPPQVEVVTAAVKPKPVTSAADAVSAAVSARAQGARVEVEELRDEFSTTWVNPDGSFTTQAHAGVVRFKDAKGAWRNVDLNLAERTDGTVGAKSHPLGVSLADKSKGAGGGAKGGTSYGASDDVGHKAAIDPVDVHDLHATLLHLLGLDHKRLTFNLNGRDFRLTDVAGRVIKEVCA